MWSLPGQATTPRDWRFAFCYLICRHSPGSHTTPRGQYQCRHVQSERSAGAFWLGGADIIDELRIRWPNGQMQTLLEVSVDQYLTITIPDPGDFDGDGNVDGRDFLAWQRNPNIGNLADWQANYGMSRW
jgi:hypothetical protein